MNTYIVGQVVFLRAYLTDPSTGDPDDVTTQTPVDDPTIAMTVYKPDGTNATPGLSHVSTGTYTTSITADIAGAYKAVTLSTGAAAGAGDDRFYVAPVP
jgi:hypothetical protein